MMFLLHGGLKLKGKGLADRLCSDFHTAILTLVTQDENYKANCSMTFSLITSFSSIFGLTS